MTTSFQPETIESFKAKLSKAFADLRARGYFARQNFSCCGRCAVAEINASAGIDGRAGFVYYHRQDAAGLRESFDFVEKSRFGSLEDVGVYIGWKGNGAEIAEAFRAAGLGVEWNGAEATRIRVGLKPVDPPKDPAPIDWPVETETDADRANREAAEEAAAEARCEQANAETKAALSEAFARHGFPPADATKVEALTAKLGFPVYADAKAERVAVWSASCAGYYRTSLSERVSQELSAADRKVLWDASDARFHAGIRDFSFFNNAISAGVKILRETFIEGATETYMKKKFEAVVVSTVLDLRTLADFHAKA